MSEYYSYGLVAEYIINLLEKIKPYPSQMKTLCNYLHEQHPFYDFDFEKYAPEDVKNSEFQIQKLRGLLNQWGEQSPSYEFQKIQSLKEIIGLDEDDIKIIEFGYLLRIDPFFANFISQASSELRWAKPAMQLSFLLGMDVHIITQKCFGNSLISSTGIIFTSDRRYHITLEDIVTISQPFSRWIENRDSEDIVTVMCGYPATPELKPEDYFYIEQDRKRLSACLKQALNGKNTGVNILIYGEPGTGKTELVKTIAQDIGAKLFAIGEEPHLEDTIEITRSERLYRLNMANILLKDKPKSLLLFDEMEDLLHQGYGHKKESKIFMNRLLERNDIPTIWVCNSINRFDPAFLRRMQFVYELKKPPVNARIQTWENIVKAENLSIPHDDIVSLACEFDEPPALTTSAIKTAKMVGGSRDDIAATLNNMRRAMGRKIIAPKANDNSFFNADLSNADMDLQDLAFKLCRQKAHLNFSLCLYGVSGTGKSAYARHLAEYLGLDVSHIRASNLISPFVGETEQKIAKAFETAKENKQILIFDEADSFLQERRNARNSWEITAVNEMLTWMECHPYVLERTKCPDANIGARCFKPFECDYKSHCWAHVPDYSIYNLFAKSKADDIAKRHGYKIENLPDDIRPTGAKLVDMQSYLDDSVNVEPHSIERFLNGLKYPLYFLDYETIMPSLPLFDGTRPFQQIPFQFSLHIQDDEKSALRHFEFLHKEQTDPRLAFVKSLVDLCGKQGSVIVYNQAFEAARNNELARDFPEYATALEDINQRMVDLLVPFKNRWLYHPSQKSSASIKAVLPAFTDLSYKDMEIGNGGEAMQQYGAFMAGQIPKDAQPDLWRNLGLYCEQDTYAMVELLNVLKKRAIKE